MRKVAIYARVSTEHEAQLSALDNQVQYYDEIISKHSDWIVYKRYIDEGITGTSIKKRKNFMKMIEDAKNGYFDLIITREVSRFARNTVDTLQVTRELKKIGVEVYFTEDNIWTFKDEDGELKLTIMATLAQNESKKISQRVKAGQKISFLNGVIYGTGNVLGYDKVGKEMIINEEQAKTVKYIFDSFIKGNGTSKIKYDLEQKGILTATGLTNWNQATITRVLKNPFYCGKIIYRKSYVPDYLEQKAVKNCGQVEQIEVQGTHEPIISIEDFDKVQEIIASNSKHITKRGNYNRPSNVWSKKLVCSCGSSFNRRVYHKNEGEITYCYQCYNQKNKGSKKYRLNKGLDITEACDIPLVSEWKLELIANSIFSLLCEDKGRIIAIINKLLEAYVEEDAIEINEELIELKEKLSNYEIKLSKLLDMYLNDLVTKESYIIKKNELEKNIQSTKLKIVELNVEESNEGNNLLNKLNELKQIIQSDITNDNSCISDIIIEGLFSKVIVEKNKFIFKLNCGKSSNEEVLITKLIITKDDVKEYESKHHQYKKLRLKESIIVDVVI